jgi:hypothetical protein
MNREQCLLIVKESRELGKFTASLSMCGADGPVLSLNGKYISAQTALGAARHALLLEGDHRHTRGCPYFTWTHGTEQSDE